MTYPNVVYGFTMTILRRSVTGTDEYGNDVYTETAVSVPQCIFQPAGSTEGLAFADQLNVSDTIFLPAGTDISALDRIQFGDDVFEIMGKPEEWFSPFSGRVSPIRVSVTKITGGSP